MEEKKILNDEELTNVNGGSSYNVDGSNLEIFLDPNESAVTELKNKLDSGIQFYGFSLTVEDPNNCLMPAAYILDEPDKKVLSRKCTVAYSLELAKKKVIVKSVTVNY